MTETALLEGREAAGRYAWSEAQDLLGRADAGGSLAAEDLMLLAESTWWMGKMRECITIRERAYRAFLAAGETKRAAYAAIKLADHHNDLADEEESVEHGHLMLMNIMSAVSSGDMEAAAAAAAETRRIGQRFHDKDLIAFGLATEGISIMQGGDVERGLAMIEEATVPAVSGELGPYATGWIFCIMISSSSKVADWQRAGQWAEAAKRWCDRQAISGFPGVCRVHRAEIMRLRGSLGEAEEEALLATQELGTFNVWIAAAAFRELGEIRLRTGDLDEAEVAFRQANELGANPQPGMALVQMRRGKVEAAASSLKRAIADEGDPLERAKLLPVLVEVSLAVDDGGTARSGCEELARIADGFKSSAIRAAAAASSALVKLAEGDPPAAEIEAKLARRLWKDNDVLYEAARVGVTLGDVYLAEGDRDGAAFEYTTALQTFEKFGALPDADTTRKKLAAVADAPEPAGRRVAKTFLFSDIVRSTNLIEAIGDEAWTDLLKWHDDTLRNSFHAHHGEEVTHTGDGFFIAFETADDAVACAVSIQRALAEHRRAHGFAPQVRIGLHATEASPVEGNYHGKGVHEAARIGALAEGGEILTSVSTMECLAGPVAAGDEREVTLKGVSGPVRLVSLRWRD